MSIITGEALRARIEANLARQQQPELSAIHLVRGAGDLTAAMPRFVTAFVEAQISTLHPEPSIAVKRSSLTVMSKKPRNPWPPS